MSEFIDSFEHYTEGLHVSPGACPGCDDCGLADCPDMDCEEYELADEPSFSWSQCDGCGSTLGGDRHPAHGTYTDDSGEFQIIHLDVCVDCLMFTANGDEPEEWPQNP